MRLNFKKIIICLFLSIGFFSYSSGYANEAPGIINYQGSNLVLNGQGTRVIFFMKVYEGSLYLETKSTDAEKIINDNASMAIRLDVTSEMVTAKAMKKALSDGFDKSTNSNISPISNEIDQLASSFNSDVSSCDFYEFIYIKEIGTHVLKNNELVTLIPGLDFKKAFFGIFLSNNPIQKNLKKAMLGG